MNDRKRLDVSTEAPTVRLRALSRPSRTAYSLSRHTAELATDRAARVPMIDDLRQTRG